MIEMSFNALEEGRRGIGGRIRLCSLDSEFYPYLLEKDGILFHDTTYTSKGFWTVFVLLLGFNLTSSGGTLRVYNIFWGKQ